MAVVAGDLPPNPIPNTRANTKVMAKESHMSSTAKAKLCTAEKAKAANRIGTRSAA